MEWYPIIFEPIYKEKIWGGDVFNKKYGRNVSSDLSIGESFELSCFDNEVSIIKNGVFKGAKLSDILKQFSREVTGEKLFELYRDEFPLLFKIIDAKKDLSVQVHPSYDDVAEMKQGKHKNEFWYILDSHNGKLNIGFNDSTISKDDIKKHIDDGNLQNLLSYYDVEKGDSFYIRAGTVHAICSNVLLAEIQTASDTTYRLYDYNRKGIDGKPRELHTKEALMCINTAYNGENSKSKRQVKENNKEYNITTLTENPYFSIEEINLSGIIRNKTRYSSFDVFMIISGHIVLYYRGGELALNAGDTVLIPAFMGEYSIEGNATILDTYIER